ncbi:VLRF1 family aeRF1-type release factor [Exiguobacterium sp. Helios]
MVIGERLQANFLERALTTKPKQVIHKNLSQSSQHHILKQVF